MQSLSFSLSGNIFLLILLILLIIGFSIYSYLRTNPTISRGKRILLTSLRSIALSLLLFAIFEPIITASRSVETSPKYAVLIDNSISMGINDANGNRKPKLINALNESKILEKNENAIYGILDENLLFKDKLTVDSINLKGETTDLSTAISTINSIKDYDNLKSIILVTDGAYNKGNSPLIEAEKSGKQYYIIGIGDTNSPKDILIHSVITNEIAYIDNVLPINININYQSYSNLNTKVRFLENDKLIEEKELFISTNSTSSSLFFEYTPKTEGTKKLSFQVVGFDDEITKQNNLMSKYVKVLKNKRRISLFAGYSSPDISFLKNIIQNQKGIEFNEYVQKLGSEFYRTPSQQDIAETELFILVGFPINTTPENILEMISKQLALGKPVLFISGFKTDYQKLKKLEEYLPFTTASSQNREIEVFADFNPKSTTNPIMRVTGSEKDIEIWNSLSPLFKTETFVRTKPGSEVLAEMKINNTVIKEPLIITRDIMNKKSIAILGYGLYKWKLNSYASEIAKGRKETYNLLDIFILNSMRWLSVNEQSRRIRIQPTKSFFSESEPVEFVAQIYDAAFTPIDNADVTVKIETQDGAKEIVFSQIGNGRYFASINNLIKGDYRFSGKAQKSGQNIGTDDGRFTVGGLNAEYSNLIMNKNLLKNMAEYTNGKFYLSDNASELLKDLESSPNFKSQINTNKFDYQIWNNIFLMGLAIVLFSVEWFIRKRSGLI